MASDNTTMTPEVNKNVVTKIDKRKKTAYTEDQWANIQSKRLGAFISSQNEKKRKLEEYDKLVSLVKEKDDKIRYLELKLTPVQDLQTFKSELEETIVSKRLKQVDTSDVERDLSYINSILA